MTHYQPGQRVALTHTGKPDTPPWPGEQGVVRAYDSGTQVVHVGWDNGTVTAIRLDAGDRLDILAASTAIPAAAWNQALATATSRGSQDGRLAVDRWAHDTLTDPAEARTTARRVLAAVKDDDPEAAETLPSSASSAHSQPLTDWQLSDLLADGNPADWRPVSSEQWEQAVWAYRDAFDATVRDTAVSRCRRTLIPAADGRDLDEMHPDRVRFGGIGVFSGEWMWIDGGNGPDYARAGFLGTLIDTWNGWAVFSCTRQVAEAIVADQQDQRDQQRQQLQATGVPEPDLQHQIDATFAVLSFDGDTLVADQRIPSDDPDAIEYITPDADGRYVVMGRTWCWEVVDPYRCDRITGELPPPAISSSSWC